MTDRIQCPICHYANIPGNMETCPQCDSDLTCFLLLDRLSGIHPPSSFEAATKETSTFEDMSDDLDTHPLNSNDPTGRHQRPVIWALAALTILLAVFFTFLTYRLSTVEHLLHRQYAALTDLLTAEGSLENNSQKQNHLLELIRKQEIMLAQNARLKTYIEDVEISISENGTRLELIESRLSNLLSHREMDPIIDTKKYSQVAIKPILIISESLETDIDSKIIGIDME